MLDTLAPEGGGGNSFGGQYGEAPPDRGTFFRLQVNERVRISLVEVYKRVGKSVILVCKQGLTDAFHGREKNDENVWLCDLFIF